MPGGIMDFMLILQIVVLLGAVQMDDTGTTRIGKYVFNHAFFIPGLLAIVFSVGLGFVACMVF